MDPASPSPYPVFGETLFYDGFSARELDRAKWNMVTTGRVANGELQGYVDDLRTISVAAPGEVEGADGGALVLEARHEPGFNAQDGRPFDFVSGRIDTHTRFAFRYGRAAARMRLPAGIGLWPAFWLLGEGVWPECGEIDIMESVGDPAWVSAAVHGPGYAGESALVNRYYFNDPLPATAWHVYSVNWHRDEVVFKVDDNVAYRVTRAMVDVLGPWVFDRPKYLILNLALGGTYPYKVHGVAEPYYGLPQETVEKIRAGQAKVYVDWVCVQTQPQV